MVRRDFSDKLSAKVLRDLIKRDWWTKITQNSGTKPAIDFKGFYGDYQVTATCNGKTVQQKIHLGKGAKNVFEIKFQ
jgi:hypothetical protein